MKVLKQLATATVAFGTLAGAAFAAPVNGTGLVTPDVIFGTGGNANGSFTGQSVNGIEVGLRAKQRFAPANIFNYDGVDTYTFDTAVLNGNPSNLSVFNFEWAVNVDTGSATGMMLDDVTHLLEFDTDAGAGVSYAGFDPLNTPGYFDHSLGNNGTGSNAGIESTSNADLTANSSIYNVMQQSANLGFGFSTDPDAPGSYAFRYSLFDSSTNNLLVSAEINVNVLPLPAPVPLPASGLILLSGMGVFAAFRRRQTRKS